MKVAIDVVPIRTNGEMGGAFQLVIEIIRGLVQFDKTDNYLLLTADWNHDYFEQFERFGVERICVQTTHPNSPLSNVTKKPFLRKAIEKLYRIVQRRLPYLKIQKGTKKTTLRSRAVDVLFCPMSAINYSEPGIPVLSLIYDLQHEYYPQFFSYNEIETRKRFYDGISRDADYTVSISEFTRQTVIEKLGFAPDKSEMIYISIHDRVKIGNEKIEAILRKFNIENKKYAFFPANYWPHKNHKMLLLAYSILLKNNPELDIHLCLTGSLLQNESSFTEIVQQMGLGDRVNHLGYVTEEEVAALMSGAYFMIFPSLFEGFGIPVAEAMMAGTPVLCSENTSLPEVGGEAVVYFDPRRPLEIADKMYEVITNEDLRKELIGKGFKQVERFNSASMIEQYHKLLKKVSNSESKEKYSLTGVYEDNWSSNEVIISVGEDSGKQKMLYIELILPSFVPRKHGIIYLFIDNKKKKILFEKDIILKIEEELPSSSGDVTLIIQNSFKPSEIGIEDNRELGVQLQKICIIEKGSRHIIKTLHGVEA